MTNTYDTTNASTTGATTGGSTTGMNTGGSTIAGTTTGSNLGGSTMGGSNTGGSTATGSGRLVTGLFRDRESAEAAYAATHARGYGSDDVNVAMSDETRQRHFGDHTGAGDTELGNKAGKGSAIGGTIGAIAAAIAAVGTSLVLPGLGLVVAGPLAAAVAGAAGGGIIGALIGWGIPEERVKEYEQGIKGGGILMGVHARNDEDAAHFENQWRTGGGQQVYR